MNTYLLIFWEFFKTGLFSIGGGLATLPFLFAMAEKYSWFTTEQLTNMIAVSESTPGPIGINMATYVGFTAKGVAGGILSTLSLVLPSIIVILIIACILDKFRDNKYIIYAFYGLRPAVVGLLAVSLLSVYKQTFFINAAQNIFSAINWQKAVLFAVLLFLVLKFKKHPILYIALGAVAGIITKL